MSTLIAADELTARVSQSLEKQGILNKLRAELRQYVFSVLNGLNPSDVSIEVPPFPSNPKSPQTEHQLLLAVIEDYLSVHQLHQTLSMLRLEAGVDDNNRRSHSSLLSDLHLQSSHSDRSVLAELYLSHLSSVSPSIPLPSTPLASTTSYSDDEEVTDVTGWQSQFDVVEKIEIQN